MSSLNLRFFFFINFLGRLLVAKTLELYPSNRQIDRLVLAIEKCRYKSAVKAKYVLGYHRTQQGSVLGPLLWNIMYNEVLNLTLLEETTIVGFADDIAIIVAEKKTGSTRMASNWQHIKRRP